MAVKRCPHCGAKVPSDAVFCTNCGRSLRAAPPARAPTRAAAPAAQVAPPRRGIILTTTPNVPGYRIKEVLGVVYGMTIRTRGAWGRFLAGLTSVVGGRSEEFLKEFEKARNEALSRLIAHATRLKADAVVGIEFETSDVLGSFIMFAAHGTAVRIEPLEEEEEEE